MIYVVSDIHGYFEKLKELLKKIKFTKKDTLYILGDIIDRGPQVIDLIRYVMCKSNIKMIVGNHEDMMLTYYKTGSSYDKSLWYSNGGEVTDKEFSILSKAEQKEILQFFSDLPLEYNINVNNHNYNLVHGSYVSKEDKERYTLEQYRNQIIWGRISKRNHGPEDCIAIFGHTCTRHYLDNYEKYSIWKQDNLIGIDCGMASYSVIPNKAQLGCLCLDNLKEYYVS